ncbi:L,D-transpeptidase family protein [Novosphingobium sp.]|uniref:L,D-transpeptidase family protein n=1 Tax=Novosphingobium sp. TaxID=1874826 RepID=UPI00333EDB14
MVRFARISSYALGLALLSGTAPGHGAGVAQAQQVDRLLIEKAARRITLFAASGAVVQVYQAIQLGWQPVGAKHFAGDGRTPEGHYRIDRGLENSAYHLALHVSYPSTGDRAFAADRGRDPGGAIFIHGQPNGMDRPAGDWTAGCIAVDNQQIEEIWSLVGDDTPVDIVP